MSADVVAYFDGLCEPAFPGGPRNPGGIACGGWYVELGDGISSGRMYREGEGATSNVAEYMAALDALRAAYKAGHRGIVTLVGDSQLLVKQFNGEYACNSPHLQELLAQLRHAATFFERVEVRWIPREENVRADRQSRIAYDQARGVRV